MKRPNKIERVAIDALAQGSLPMRWVPLRDAIEDAYPGAIERAVKRIERESFEAKFHGPVPEYAKRYVAKYWPRLDSLRWRRSRTTLRGTCATWDSAITVTERIGTDETRMKILVLHEIAHRVGYGHDEKYSAELRRLLVAEGLYRAALKSGLSGQSKLRRVKAATTSQTR